MGHKVEEAAKVEGEQCFCCKKVRPGKMVSSSADGSGAQIFVCNECDHVSKR